MPEIIDGNATAKSIHEELAAKLKSISAPRTPCVAFIRVGEDPASVSYVKKKGRVAGEIGIESRLHVLPESTQQDELNALIDKLNADDNVDAILIQAPLPKHLCERDTFNRVRPDKDVDGFSCGNLGLLCQEDARAFTACTPAGIMELLKRYNVATAGKNVVVLGRSIIVGKPMATLMMQKAYPGDCTVTVCHSRSENLKEMCLSADIIIVALGVPEFLKGDMVKEGAVIVDVGTTRVPDATRKSGFKLTGDVKFDEVAPKCSYITPVPGGVGPMTIISLMRNTLLAGKKEIYK